MNIRRTFLTAIAVLMVPGFAMAQSTVTFDVGVDFDGLDDVDAAGLMVEATVTCNAGIPLSSTAMVGQAAADRVAFTVTEFTPGSCDVTFADVPYDGWQYDGDQSCTGLTASDSCTALVVPAPVAFEVTVDWEISEDADPGVGAGAFVIMACGGERGGIYTLTSLPAGPGVDMPITITGLVPDAEGDSLCVALLDGLESAVDVDTNECLVPLVVGSDAVCVFSATAFYEGIPTLSQYGMALMALLMLGVGFVGFRRFV